MGDQAAHALFSPSSAHKWMRCAGALAMEHGLPSTTNDSAEQGTAAAELASWALTDGVYQTFPYLGRVTSNGWDVTEDMCEATQIYVDAIRNRVAEYYAAGAVDVIVLIENRVDISDVVGHPEQFGTSDAIILVEWRDGAWLIEVADLKYGYRMVNAEDNEQLMVYALGALRQYGLLGNFTTARMTIHQPNRDHVSEWEIPIEQLLEFGQQVTLAAHRARDVMAFFIPDGGKADKGIENYLTPGEKQCQYCKAAGTCPKLEAFAQQEVGAEFEDLTKEYVDGQLSAVGEQSDAGEAFSRHLKAIPLLEIWCRGVLAAAEAFMFKGGKVPGFKVVAGKKGRRSWASNSAEAEAVMKSMRLKMEEMYSMKLISPTQAEKLLKKESPRRWKKLEELVVQSEGKDAVVEESDKRPALAIQSPEDDFVALANDDNLA